MARKVRIISDDKNISTITTKTKIKSSIKEEPISKKKNLKKLFLISIGIIVLIIILIIAFKENVIPKINKNYYCPDGYELREKKCYKTDYIIAEKEYYCYSGMLIGEQCVTETYYPVQTRDNCPTGYSMFGFKCRKWGTSTNYDKCGSFNMTYSYVTNMCYAELDPIETKYCNIGELYGNKCVSRTYTQANYDYKCPIGYTLSYTTCEKEISIDAYIK